MNNDHFSFHFISPGGLPRNLGLSIISENETQNTDNAGSGSPTECDLALVSTSRPSSRKTSPPRIVPFRPLVLRGIEETDSSEGQDGIRDGDLVDESNPRKLKRVQSGPDSRPILSLRVSNNDGKYKLKRSVSTSNINLERNYPSNELKDVFYLTSWSPSQSASVSPILMKRSVYSTESLKTAVQSGDKDFFLPNSAISVGEIKHKDSPRTVSYNIIKNIVGNIIYQHCLSISHCDENYRKRSEINLKLLLMILLKETAGLSFPDKQLLYNYIKGKHSLILQFFDELAELFQVDDAKINFYTLLVTNYAVLHAHVIHELKREYRGVLLKGSDLKKVCTSFVTQDWPFNKKELEVKEEHKELELKEEKS